MQLNSSIEASVLIQDIEDLFDENPITINNEAAVIMVAFSRDHNPTKSDVNPTSKIVATNIDDIENYHKTCLYT